MKHYLHDSLRALFLFLALFLSLPMLAVEVEIDGINYDFLTKTKQATVIAKKSGKYSGDIVIPESVEQAKGVITPAIDVHHIDSFTKYDGTKKLAVAYNYANLLSVCKKCHQKLHNIGISQV